MNHRHENTETKAPTVSKGDRSRWDDRKVLLVDDNPTNLAVAHALLSRNGIDVHKASDGQKALDMASAQTFDLILMDCMMPEMDGFETTRAIRGNSACPNAKTPVIALTANVMPEDKQRCLDSGMDDYLPKPLRPKPLTELLAKWLERDAEAGPTSELDEKRVFNKQVLLELFSDSVEIIESLISTFERGLDDQFVQIDDAISNGSDAESLRRIVHTIKGTAGNYGAERLESRAAQMEIAIRNGDLKSAIEIYPSLKDEGRALREALASVDWSSG